MEKKVLKTADVLNKLKKLNAYEALWVDLDKIFKEIQNEEINILEYRNEIKDLIQKVIKTVSNYDYFFIKLLSGLETPVPFIAHSMNTAILSYILSLELNVESLMIPKIMQAALLHDIGKLNFSEKIKELYIYRNEDPAEVMKNHPVWGERILLYHLKTDPEIARLALNHHEKSDGSGFPRGLKGTDLTIHDHILVTANLIDNLVRKLQYPSFEALSKNINVLVTKYSHIFIPPIKDALLNIFNTRQENRSKRRFRLNAKGSLFAAYYEQALPCEIRNISANGMEIGVKALLDVGTFCKVNAKISQNISLKEMRCSIIWTRKSGDKYLYGLKFEGAEELPIDGLLE